MMSWSFTPQAWIILGCVLGILELLIPGIFLFWFGLSALCVGLIGLFFPLSLVTSIAIFAVLSIVFVLIAILVIRKSKPDTKSIVTQNLNQVLGSQYVGKTFVTSQKVENGTAQLKIGDSVWIIEGKDCPEGTHIKITDVKQNTLYFTILS